MGLGERESERGKGRGGGTPGLYACRGINLGLHTSRGSNHWVQTRRRKSMLPMTSHTVITSVSPSV